MSARDAIVESKPGQVDTRSAELRALHAALGELLATERRRINEQIDKFDRKLATLYGAVDGLRSAVRVLSGAQPPPPAKFPSAKAWTEDCVYHEGDVVTCTGSTYQATKDTARAPGTTRDWLCLAAGFDVKGTYNDGDEPYKRHDVIALSGSSFVALCDNPGPCPGENWQLIASRGSRGQRGISGARGLMGLRGESGLAAPTITAWQLDRQRYVAFAVMSDGSFGPSLDLRGLFEQFLMETGSERS